MKERLQKILSARGVASRRRAEEYLLAGRVRVNGRTASLGESADPERDEILLDGKPLPPQQCYVYILLNKPRGYVTTLSDEKHRRNVAELVADCGIRVYPVGRLDMDSEGLLLLTNDGAFAQRLMHPSHQVDKTYIVWTDGACTGSLERLRRPIVLDGYRISPPEVTLLEYDGSRAKFRITIHEGRNRQIRRMCQSAGLTVTRLRRIAEGGLQLGTLVPGQWRYLTEEEVAGLK
ncbi:MAG: rRNA pseudouridine synthase [Firmicutes bacterium]|nr:rRNA pseudouridine synthase [Bacillota bacterium]